MSQQKQVKGHKSCSSTFFVCVVIVNNKTCDISLMMFRPQVQAMLIDKQVTASHIH